MNRTLQNLLLRAYGHAVRAGWLERPWFRSIYLRTYDLYKSLLEARGVRALRPFVDKRGIVIDVGANVGFFTLRFARWIDDGGVVIAIEPEPANFEDLRWNLERAGLASRVRAVRGVAAEASGTLKLELNPLNPGDHKLADAGIEVAAHTLDELVASSGNGRVSLIKIDVQGAEDRVLQGAETILRRDSPAILIEVYDSGLRAMHSSADRLVSRLVDAGYTIMEIMPRVRVIARDVALARCRDGGYADLLFVKDGARTKQAGAE